MVDKQVRGLTATKLRIFLIATMVLLLIIGGGLFWLMRMQFVEIADKVRSTNTEAATASTDAARLQSLQNVLEEEKVAVTRASNIVANSESYQYQEKLLDDLSLYAKKANIQIVSINYNSIDAAGGAGSIPGLKKISITITLGTPTPYKSIMHFIRLIEYNLTKMQVTGISMANATPGTGKLDLSVPSLDIEVYAR